MSVAVRPRSSKSSSLPTPDQLAGWPLDPKERGDFFHSPRVFPKNVATWRQQMLDRIVASQGRTRGRGATQTREDLRTKIDEGIAHLVGQRSVAVRLTKVPRLPPTLPAYSPELDHTAS
jgi:hypothetical protein